MREVTYDLARGAAAVQPDDGLLTCGRYRAMDGGALNVAALGIGRYALYRVSIVPQ